MPIVPIVMSVAVDIIMGAFNCFAADTNPKRANISDMERTKRKYWYYRRKSRYKWK